MNHLFEHHFLKTQLDKLDLPTPLIVRENEPVAATIERMSKEGNSCTLVVCKDGTPSGIFTERDVVKKVALNEDKTLTLQISDVMTRNPITVRSSVSVARALYEMSLGGFRHLPIIAGATPKLRILSTEEVIDFVYLHLTKRIADRPTDNLGRSSIE